MHSRIIRSFPAINVGKRAAITAKSREFLGIINNAVYDVHSMRAIWPEQLFRTAVRKIQIINQLISQIPIHASDASDLSEERTLLEFTLDKCRFLVRVSSYLFHARKCLLIVDLFFKLNDIARNYEARTPLVETSREYSRFLTLTSYSWIPHLSVHECSKVRSDDWTRNLRSMTIVPIISDDACTARNSHFREKNVDHEEIQMRNKSWLNFHTGGSTIINDVINILIERPWLIVHQLSCDFHRVLTLSRSKSSSQFVANCTRICFDIAMIDHA